jgi:FkbM family methyltransferase
MQMKIGIILKNKIARTLKYSSIWKLYIQSAGNIWYPLISFLWWIAKLLVPRRKVIIGDLSFTLSCTNWITHFRWFLFNKKEPETILFLDNYLKEDNIFFDVGANVGVFTLYAAKKYQKIKIYSFEPEVSNLAVLKDNIFANNVTDKIITYGIAISDFTGLSKLHIQDITTGSALHTENTENIKKSNEGKHPIVWAEGVYAVTLDYFCDELNIIPNSIKIDTDGNEKKILRGAKKILKNPVLKAIIIEMPADEVNHCQSILLESDFVKKEHSFKETRNEIWIKG